jgi:hypothetical protein
MNLLALIQHVCDELGINRPPQVVGLTDPQIRQLLALLNRLGTDLCRQYEWQQLNKEYILQTVAYTRSGTTTLGSPVVTGIPSTTGLTTQFGAFGDGLPPFAQIVSVDSPTQVTLNMPATASGTTDLLWSQVEYDLPSDWKKQIPQTEWDRVNRWPLMGPQSPQDWQSFKSGIVYNGPRERFRIYQNTIAVNPPPPNGLVFAFEYISSGWVTSAAGVAQTQYLADTDTAVFEDSLLVTGLKVQWKAAKGLDATWDLAEFRQLLDANKSQNKSAPRLSLSPTFGTVLLTENNLPDSNYGGVI